MTLTNHEDLNQIPTGYVKKTSLDFCCNSTKFLDEINKK